MQPHDRHHPPVTLCALVVAAAAALLFSAAPAVAQPAASLDQGWTEADRHFFYRTTQGSRLIRYNLFMALEVADGDEPFAGPNNLSDMGFLYEAPTPDNPDGLPIGFVEDSTEGGPSAIGFTCSACHTRDISYNGVRFRIDGSQGAGDMERLLHELEEALFAARFDADKFARLRLAVGYTETQLQNLLDEALAKLQKENASNLPAGASQNNPGPGRLDAFAHIKNRVADYVYPDSYLDTASNNIDATAPVSYPFLWDAPYLDYVQWPGNVPNWGPGSLARNVGEVLGVFAETSVERNFWGQVQVTTSANVPNLLEIEEHLLELQSPQWPDAFPPINPYLAAYGEPLFDQYCGSCHVTVDRQPRTRHIDTYAIGADILGTDPNMADNNLDDTAPQGLMGPSYNADDLINPIEILDELVLDVVFDNDHLYSSWDLTISHQQPLLTAARNTQLAAGEDDAHTYKARPLNGIWATAPYLHNGSVRTLEDLMKPGPEREAYFFVGSTEYDPEAGGFVPNYNPATGNTHFFNTYAPGNSRLGHEYGTPADTRFPALTELQRTAIVEYMKGL